MKMEILENFEKMEKNTLLLSEKEEDLEKAAEILKRGGLVVFPTETVYGLGGSAENREAVADIFRAKGRPSDNPLIVHIAEIGDVERYAKPDASFFRLAERFMPGPLTVILPKKDILPDNVTGGLDTVAIRMPSNRTANRLISLAGGGIAAPSANLSGKPSTTAFRYVVSDMRGRVDAIIDGGDCSIGVESTVIKCDPDGIKLLRPGRITVEELREISENVVIDKAVYALLKDGERPMAPGMKYKHYAPKAQVILLTGEEEKIREFFALHSSERDVGILCFDEDLSYLYNKGGNVLSLGKRSDREAQAKRLFTYLRDMDAVGVSTIYARIPERDGLGLAIYNRLTKAAGFTVKSL